MAIITQVTDLPFRFGGEEHSGWLPPGAARPLPTPVQNVLLTVEIHHDSSGYFLYSYSHDKSRCADNWYQTLAEAERDAFRLFGITAEQWVER